MNKLEQLVKELRSLGYEAEAVASTERKYGFIADYTTLSEKDFGRVLSKVTDLAELEGLTNRRRLLGLGNLPKYPRSHLELIKRRKWELENA